MTHHTNERLPGLSLSLCEQTNEIHRGTGRIFMADLAKIYRNGVRHS